MFTQLRSKAGIGTSKLFDQDTFYPALISDLKTAKHFVIIESPFITVRRVSKLMPIIERLTSKGVKVLINTKPCDEQSENLARQSDEAVAMLQAFGVTVLFTVGHHRKTVVIDHKILWEGSLNVLSQHDSCELMRRVYSEQLANQMLAFTGLSKYVTNHVE